MEGRGQWEVVLYNPAEKQTVLYNGYDHTLRILDGGASVHGSILMPAPPRRTSIDYVPNNAEPATTPTTTDTWGVAPVLRQKLELGISPSAVPAFPQKAQNGHGTRCPLCRQHLPPYIHHELNDHRKHNSPPKGRRYISPNYFELISFSNYRSSVDNDEDDEEDICSDQPEPILLSEEENTEFLDDGRIDRSLDGGISGATQRRRRTRTKSLRARAFNQDYYRKFFIEEVCLGRGAFGSVYLCHHILSEVNLGKYAIKKVPVGNDHPRLAAVLQEVKALERLQHPNIISYKHSWLERTKLADFGPDNIPTLFILTEYANAGNLHDFIFYNPDRIPENKARRRRVGMEKQRATLNPLANTANARTYFLDNAIIWSFFTDMINGLSHLHHRGIIHCDLKPQNLLLDKYDDIVSKQELTRILISDFGSVKSLLKGERIPRTGNTGTIAYMPPEALMTDTSGRYLYDYDEKSDVWSAGVILYEMCYSESPFHNTESIEELEREIIGTQGITEFPRTPIPRPPIFAWLIQWMLQGDPAKRPSMDDILGIPEVRKYNTGTPRPPAPAEPPAPLSTAHLLELSSQIMQTSIPARPPTSTRPKNRQLVGPEAQIIKPRRPLCPSSPRISSGGASSASPTSAVNNPPVASVPPSPSSPQPFPKPSAVLQLPSYMMPFLGPVINFCMNHLDAFMRQSLFAIALIIKLALCYDEANRPWSSSYMHLMVSLSLGTMLLCLTTGRLMARLQVACIIGQWLLAVMCWGWLGHAHNNGTVLWELLLMMLLELMLSFLFSALKLAKTDQHKGQRLLIR